MTFHKIKNETIILNYIIAYFKSNFNIRNNVETISNICTVRTGFTRVPVIIVLNLFQSEHCYDNEQQFQLARSIINDEIGVLKAGILDDGAVEIISPDRLNSLTIDALLGYRYQSRDKGEAAVKLPKRFTQSLPNDVTLGRIINGESISYEVLRKTLMLL